mgnify:CR=1 FL=1
MPARRPTNRFLGGETRPAADIGLRLRMKTKRPSSRPEDLNAALAARKGPILPLIGTLPDRGHAMLERHVCIDTTAAGGNAALLAEVGRA